MLVLLACTRFAYNRRDMLLFELHNAAVKILATQFWVHVCIPCGRRNYLREKGLTYLNSAHSKDSVYVHFYTQKTFFLETPFFRSSFSM